MDSLANERLSRNQAAATPVMNSQVLFSELGSWLLLGSWLMKGSCLESRLGITFWIVRGSLERKMNKEHGYVPRKIQVFTNIFSVLTWQQCFLLCNSACSKYIQNLYLNQSLQLLNSNIFFFCVKKYSDFPLSLKMAYLASTWCKFLAQIRTISVCLTVRGYLSWL